MSKTRRVRYDELEDEKCVTCKEGLDWHVDPYGGCWSAYCCKKSYYADPVIMVLEIVVDDD